MNAVPASIGVGDAGFPFDGLGIERRRLDSFPLRAGPGPLDRLTARSLRRAGGRLFGEECFT